MKQFVDIINTLILKHRKAKTFNLRKMEKKPLTKYEKEQHEKKKK